VTAASGYPRAIWAPAGRALRQGDIAVTFCHQLRAARKDAPGPGPAATASERIPFLGAYQDFPIGFGDGSDVRKLSLRVWQCWAMVLSQSCELDRQEADDSRVLIAPIVFQTKWPGDHW
jgi:hypothetical protein